MSNVVNLLDFKNKKSNQKEIKEKWDKELQDKELSTDIFEDAVDKNIEKQKKLKKDRQMSNQKVTRSYNLIKKRK